MRLVKQQQGFSLIGWLVILLVAGFFLLAAFRMVPAYVDNIYIQEALESLAEDASDIQEMSDSQIRSKISKFFVVNNVRSQSAKDVKVERRQGQVLVMLNYEVRVPLLYNIDVVMSFDNVWDSERPYDCCDAPVGLNSSQ